jgi:hypothetical protein
LPPVAKPEAQQVAKPALPPVSKPEAQQAAKPAVKETAKPAVKEAAKPAVKPAPEAVVKPVAKPAPESTPNPIAQPEAKAGLKTLPKFIAGAKLDADYGKTHPGWERYIGTKTEYKLFREGDRYRAIQVLALRGESISDQYFKTLLLEFGGIRSCQVESTEKKGDYVIEHCAEKGGVGLTIYRKKNDLKTKALVLYYR